MDSIEAITWTAVIFACLFLFFGMLIMFYVFIKFYRGFGHQNLACASYNVNQSQDLEKRFSIGYTKIPTGSIDKNGRNVSGELAIEELREAVRKNTVSRRSHSMLEIPQRSRKNTNTIQEGPDFPLLSRKEVGESQFESQYFDAREEIESSSDDDYEDLEEQRFDEKEELKSKRRKSWKRKHEVNIQSEVVKRRVKALKNLLLEQKKIESRFYRDVLLIETTFDERKDSVYEERRSIISGGGIPGFWLQVLLNSKNIRQIIQSSDIPALQALEDITIENFIHTPGFKLTFTFQENEYFKNIVLSKEYYYNMAPTKSLNIQGPELSHCVGTKVQWYRHKNLTIRPVKKVRNHKIVTKFARKNSFFNFMNPPKVPEDRKDPEYGTKKNLLEAHFQIGLFFKEHLIPKASLFYAMPFYDKYLQKGFYVPGTKCSTPRKLSGGNGESDAWKLTASKTNTPSARKMNSVSLNTTLRSDDSQSLNTVKVHEEMMNHQEICLPPSTTNATENAIKSKPSFKESEIPNGNGHAASFHDEPESETVVEEDPLIGRFKMESSDKFDDYMRALGVGMLKRKLAGSVIPVNIIEISQDGLYKISTLTTVRNSELSFKLDEPFVEDTIDGRKCQTTVTRTGNLLNLDQKGQNGDKSTSMTREVEGDKMITKLFVDDIICTRIYRRMADDEE